MTPFISINECRTRIGASGVVIADCRFTLGDPGRGRRDYYEAHIPGAVYLSLDEDLAGPAGEHGGRHPLPDPARFAARLAALGVARGATDVIAYDDGGASAARLWWLLRWMGHDRVCILDGGWAGWMREDGRTEQGNAEHAPAVFDPHPCPELVVTAAEVRGLRLSGVLFDGRSAERFRGENETIDPVAGHIPGARSLPWTDTLDAEGRVLSTGSLATHFAAVPDDALMMCGSGVTACMNIAAMVAAGRPMPRLYAGSWSDWITMPDAPIATGE